MSEILFVNLDTTTPLPPKESLHGIAGDYNYHESHELHQALALLSNNAAIEVLVVDSPSYELLSKAKRLRPNLQSILVTLLPMSQYSEALNGQEELLVDHLIVNKENHSWTVNQIRITIHKLLRNDIFGLDKYCAPGTVIQEILVTGSSNRDQYNQRITAYAQEHQLGQHVCRLLYGISEELLMNAVYDAPVASGSGRYQSHPRNEPIELLPHEYAKLQFAFDGELFGISAVDPFGAFKRDRLYHYLKKVLRRHDSESIIDNKKGGAGLGIFKILYSSHAFICNVKPQFRTEIIALIDIQDQLRDFSKMARSIHYFESA